jgi:hypothetical protein
MELWSYLLLVARERNHKKQGHLRVFLHTKSMQVDMAHLCVCGRVASFVLVLSQKSKEGNFLMRRIKNNRHNRQILIPTHIT